jgi:hypothetical protein
MKDDDKNKKSKASDIIRMIREKQSQTDQSNMSIRDIANLRRAEREKEEWEETFHEWLSNMPTPPDSNSITSGPGGGQIAVDNEPFHDFKVLRPAMNALGLYRDIMEEVEFEKDVVKLKSIFSERIQQILESIDDTTANQISCKIKGVE